MKLQEGVHLHFLPTKQFTTNTIKIRFAAPMKEETVAGRVLVANLLEMANADYPTALDFRRQLALLYGASLSTSVSRRGQVHLVDVTVRFVDERYLPEGVSLAQNILEFLRSTLLRPLAKKGAFDQKVFETEKRNLISYLETEIEDHFYHADLELNKLFFQHSDMRIPRVATKELVARETPETVYQAYKDMLHLDKIDIFVLGEVDQDLIEEHFKSYSWTFRNPKLDFNYHQEFSSITREKIERKEAKQSILELAYHIKTLYNDVNYPAIVVFNSLFGSSSHSKLFCELREKEGLAYTVASSLHIFSGMLRVHAGIDKEQRQKTMKIIRQQLSDMKLGKFTDEDLALTKKLLINDATLAQDRPSTLMEQAYHQSIFGQDFRNYSQWIESVNLVSREDVIAVAKQIKLQAVYFMEGI